MQEIDRTCYVARSNAPVNGQCHYLLRNHLRYLAGAELISDLCEILTARQRMNRRIKPVAQFDPARVARFDRRRIEALLTNPAIVRNRLKVESAVSNARALLAVQKEFGSFDRFVWGFVKQTPKRNRWRRQRDVPASTPESDGLSKALKQRGFRFVGSTICYAFMQATGLVNDHLVGCYRHDAVGHPDAA